MDVVAKLDDLGKPAWIALMVGAFIVFWPLGLVILTYLIGSGRMACWKQQRRAGWQRWNGNPQSGGGERWSRWPSSHSSGNSAFDEYRTQTLRRLEEEEREFKEFLDRLRLAKDKAEFDEFLAQRRHPGGPEPQPEG